MLIAATVSSLMFAMAVGALLVYTGVIVRRRWSMRTYVQRMLDHHRNRIEDSVRHGEHQLRSLDDLLEDRE